MCDPSYGYATRYGRPHPASEKSTPSAPTSSAAGRVLADITNPMNFETSDSLTVPADSSAAAENRRCLSDSKVLKAFNTHLGPTLAAGVIGARPTTVLIAG
ncbi:hypothetical protein [Pseudarthrobacter sp. fls2-241-R2A-168]|uniref:hypothetical protein n=1 Tax=Pseudarthrobacter sp. fls2-241-R2A-168 TaxID=3040304 RepID=UPI002556211E|nr:hypothetical protein [Pseudarthrobacter sp. fls2-241-R2A-168]